MTVLMATHSMEEADQLADSLVVLAGEPTLIQSLVAPTSHMPCSANAQRPRRRRAASCHGYTDGAQACARRRLQHSVVIGRRACTTGCAHLPVAASAAARRTRHQHSWQGGCAQGAINRESPSAPGAAWAQRSFCLRACLLSSSVFPIRPRSCWRPWNKIGVRWAWCLMECKVRHAMICVPLYIHHRQVFSGARPQTHLWRTCSVG